MKKNTIFSNKCFTLDELFNDLVDLLEKLPMGEQTSFSTALLDAAIRRESDECGEDQIEMVIEMLRNGIKKANEMTEDGREGLN